MSLSQYTVVVSFIVSHWELCVIILTIMGCYKRSSKPKKFQGEQHLSNNKFKGKLERARRFGESVGLEMTSCDDPQPIRFHFKMALKNLQSSFVKAMLSSYFEGLSKNNILIGSFDFANIESQLFSRGFAQVKIDLLLLEKTYLQQPQTQYIGECCIYIGNQEIIDSLQESIIENITEREVAQSYLQLI